MMSRRKPGSSVNIHCHVNAMFHYENSFKSFSRKTDRLAIKGKYEISDAI